MKEYLAKMILVIKNKEREYFHRDILLSYKYRNKQVRVKQPS